MYCDWIINFNNNNNQNNNFDSFHKALTIQHENDQRTRKHDLQWKIELIGSVQSMEEKMKQRHGSSFQIHKRLLQGREPSIFCIHDG